MAFFYISLYLIASAQSADKPCGLAFAANQFDPDHPQECIARCSFFNWWYFSIATGIAVAVSVVSYIQENLDWGIGFGSLCVIVFCAFVVFLLDSPSYRLYAPTPGAQSPFNCLTRSIAALARSSSFSFGAIRHHHQEHEDAMAKSEEARGMLRLLLLLI